MPFFLCKLTPPRSTFAQDMSPHEAAIMQDHVAYWSALADRNAVVCFGPVADPDGAWGLAILEAPDRAEVDRITSDDPVLRKALGMRFDVFPMPALIQGGRGRPEAS